MADTVRWLGVTATKLPPTRRHRPAIWENMLGTVYAMNAAGETRYFDYDHDGARAFAGVDEPDADPRIARKIERVRYTNSETTEPRHRQFVLWVRKPAKVKAAA